MAVIVDQARRVPNFAGTNPNLLTLTDLTLGTITSLTVFPNAFNNPVTQTNSAFKVLQVAGTAARSIASTASGSYTAGTIYTTSYDVRPGTTSLVEVYMPSAIAGLVYAIFDLALNTVTQSALCVPAITDIGNGWKRVSITVVASGSGTWPSNASVLFSPVAPNEGRAVASTVTAGSETFFYACNPQLVVGAIPNAFNPV